jgi:hypothetical protein
MFFEIVGVIQLIKSSNIQNNFRKRCNPSERRNKIPAKKEVRNSFRG